MVRKGNADYTPKPPEEWRAADWPETYEVPGHPNIFAAGIAFAPPHQVSIPRKTPNGTLIAPAPPRTGMPSGVVGKPGSLAIACRIRNGPGALARHAALTRLGAACVGSAGAGLRTGSQPWVFLLSK